MNKNSPNKTSVLEQETLLLSRGFTQAKQEKDPLPGQYTIQEITEEDTKGAIQTTYTFLIHSGHTIRKLTGFIKTS